MGEMKLRRSHHVNSSASSRLSPISWFSKFLHMGGIRSSPKPIAVQKKKNSVPWPVPIPVPDSWDGGRFYCGEDDPYFRLSFGGGKSRVVGGGGLKSVWNDYDPNVREKFSDMVSDVRRTRMPSSSQNSKKKKKNGEIEEEQEMEPKRGSRNIEEDCRNLTALGRQTRRKVRVYSPRTECKIKPLEDMKKKKKKKKRRARTKKKKKPIQDRKEKTAFNKFAVVKTSYNPHEDFRDSMMEMIKEQAIEKPEELEELLACYLTLNSENYHDLIIKVFRQVWFELHLGFAPPPPTYCC